MAGIYDIDTGMAITVGLRGCTVCDEALQAARREATGRGRSVLLVDDDGEWEVTPDGACYEYDGGGVDPAEDWDWADPDEPEPDPEPCDCGVSRPDRATARDGGHARDCASRR